MLRRKKYMRGQAQATIETAAPAMTVTITAKTKVDGTTIESEDGYVGRVWRFEVYWTPVSGYPCDVEIDFGDGTSGAKTGVTTGVFWDKAGGYASADVYTVTATVHDDVYGDAEGEIDIDVRALLSVALTPDVDEGDIPLKVTFTCGCTGGFLNYSWTLAHGEAGKAPYTSTRAVEGEWTQVHTYEAVGTFTATLTIVDAKGAAALSKTIRVRAGKKAFLFDIPLLFPE